VTAGSRGNRAVCAVSIANQPHRAGHAEAMLQWALGLRSLGWAVVVVDRLDTSMAVSSEGAPCAAADSENLRYFQRVMADAGLAGCCALLVDDQPVFGVGQAELADIASGSVFFDIMGCLRDHPLAERAATRVFIDIDPGYTQLWRTLGYADLLIGHEHFVTVGQCVGEPTSSVPDCGVTWIPTPPPICLERWPAAPARPGPITSVGSWRGPWGVLEHEGSRLGQRAHSFRPLLDLPRRVPGQYELALDIAPEDARDRQNLVEAGWRLTDPRSVASDRAGYQGFIQGSSAELCVAKEIFVRLRSGWFSDRSACYLASGRPVIGLDTGFSHHMPVGEGLFAFSNLDEACAAVEAVQADPPRQARRARELAEEYLDARGVVAAVLSRMAL
jgi:hypothetical protein